MKKLIYSLAVLAVFAICPVVVSATTLQLRDGTLVRGKYLGGTSDSVNMLVDGKVKAYPVSQVLLIEFGSDSTSASTAAPAAPAKPAASPAAVQASEAVSGNTKTITVPAGTQIEVRTISTISSETNQVGDKFQASLEQPLEMSGVTLAPKDATVYGRLVQAQRAGTLTGKSELRLELTGIQVGSKVVPIVTSDYSQAGSSRGKQTAERAGIGAGIGAVIGAIAGGGKGAGIGAAVGGGAGTATQVVTHGQQVNIPSETVLDFTLAQPFTVTVPRAAAQ